MKRKIIILVLSVFGLTLNATSQTVGDYNLLIVAGTLDTDAQSELTGMGHTVTIDAPTNLNLGYDYSPYDAIIFMYNTALPSGMSEILALNENCQLGIIMMRGENIISPADVGTSVYWSSTDFTIEDNTHYITQPFSLGILDLGFTYKSDLTAINSGNTILGSVSAGNGSLVVHDTYKRVLSPYYGHTAAMPWTPDAEILMDRIIAWAVAPCCTANTGTNIITSCDSLVWIDGNTYTSDNNIATHTLTNAAGCDSVVTLNLTVNNSTTSAITETALDSYTAPSGIVHTSSGVFTDTISNAIGCDSVITIDLTLDFTGVVDLESNSINIYPNPTSENLYIEGLENLTGIQNIEITSISGATILKVGLISEIINVSNLSNGVYFIKVNHDRGVEIKKFIKE